MATRIEADDFYRAHGAVRAADAGVMRTINGVRCWTAMFTHYFNSEGTEVGYVTLDLMSLRDYQLSVFTTPRVWAESFKRDLMGWRTL